MKPKDEIKVSDSSDWKRFDIFEQKLRSHFKATSVEICDGLDQAYHDLKIENTVVTFHLEHYLGTSIYLRHPETATEDDIRVLKEIRDFVDQQNTAEQGAAANP
jgi:hypothetical protein